jgi:thymidylate synthase
MLAHVTGLTPGRLIMNLGDVHVYKNHLAAAKEQLDRMPLLAPALALNPDVLDIEKFTMDDIELVGYNHLAAIKMDMAV